MISIKKTLTKILESLLDLSNRMGGTYLPTGTNIDNLTKKHSGWWVYNRSNVSGTFPLSATASQYGIIRHIQGTSDNNAIQIIRPTIYTQNTIILYIRFKSTKVWGDWHALGTYTTNLTITRTTNSYVNAESINRLFARKKNGFLILRGNLNLTTSMPTNTEDIQIAKISGWNGMSGMFNVAPQYDATVRGTLMITVTTDGKIQISNYSGKACLGWYRFVLVVPCEDGYE